MTAKVGPMRSENDGGQLRAQRHGLKDSMTSMNSIQHHKEAVEANSGYWASRGNSDDEAGWIRQNIKMSKCRSYIPAGKNDICLCGNSEKEHENPTTQLSKTETLPTNAFGKIEFIGFGGNIAKFVRVDTNTPMSTMKTLMVDVWKMEQPSLLISVTGGAKNFKMNPRLREVFRRGLMKAAQSTGAWIITGGTHAGVMKHVGEAVKDFGLTSTNQKPVVTIGIVPWGVIQDRNDLENEQGSWPAEYSIQKDLKKKEAFLDPNHNYFFMVDNGTQHTFATEIPFRASLEQEISKMTTGTSYDAVSVPIVLLVLEGGPGTLETVENALKKDTPVVIVKGSGRAADILANAFMDSEPAVTEAKNKKNKTVKITEKRMTKKMEADIHRHMMKISFCKEQDINTQIQRIKDCLAKSELIHIFDWDSSTGTRDIDVAMLKALLKANKNQLRLALAWNRVDIAKTEIFTDKKRWRKYKLDDIMLTAIQLNRVDFVKLLLDNGVSLKEFLTIERLQQLYKNVSSKSVLMVLLKKRRNTNKKIIEEKDITLREVGLLIQDLLGDYYDPHYISDKRYVSTDVKKDLNGGNDDGVTNGHSHAAQGPTGGELPLDSNEKVKKENPDFDDPTRDLFLYSVLNNEQDMAKLFWLHGKDAIAAALIASALLYAMSHRIHDTELLAKITENNNEFMNLAIGVLKECYNSNEKKTQSLVSQKLPHWGNTTCILIAVNARNKMFISQTACQDLFSNIWMGELNQDNSTLKLLICNAIPPLILLFVKFKRNEDGGVSRGHQTDTSSERGLPSTQTQENSNDLGDSNVGITKNNGKHLSSVEKICSFYRAPVVIFFNNVISYVLFLGLYSYILISKLSQELSVQEIVLIVWVFTIFTEEIRQVYATSSKTIGTKFQSYIKDLWNIADVVSIALFIIGMTFRARQETFESARVILGVNLITFFMRLLHIFSVSKKLGPKLVMIMHMVRDLGYFFVILLVFIVAYAIASHSILFPNTELNINSLKSIFWRPYWNIYGELMLEEIEGTTDCTDNAELYGNGTHPRCPTVSGKYFVPLLMGAYMLMCNILLLNLLIAMFSYTFQKVQENTDLHWHFQRYKLIHEYHTRPFLAPPCIIIVHVIQLFKWIMKMCQLHYKPNDAIDQRRNVYLKAFTKEHDTDALRQWEDVIADAFHHTRELAHGETTDQRVKATALQLNELVDKINQIQEQQPSGAVTMEDSKSEQMTKSGTDVGSTKLDTRMENMEKQLQWIMKSLTEHNLGATEPCPEIIDLRGEEKKQEEKKAADDRALVYEMLEEQVKVHARSRTSPYPATNIHRFEVPNDKVPWDIEFLEYNPPTYTSPEVSKNPDLADQVDLYEMQDGQGSVRLKFNGADSITNTSRISYTGKYRVQNGVPLNPIGRTGLKSRGILGRWGPNHAVDPVFTRWKYDENYQRVMKDGKPEFEFVAVRRSDTELWALPGSSQPPGHHPTANLKIRFSDEAVDTIRENRKQREKLKKAKQKILKNGVLGYADDPRNTDNAWLESTVYLYEDKKNILRHFSLTATAASNPATWLTASSELPLHGAHSYFLKLVAERLDASF